VYIGVVWDELVVVWWFAEVKDEGSGDGKGE
jgi:hypothetical protein